MERRFRTIMRRTRLLWVTMSFVMFAAQAGADVVDFSIIPVDGNISGAPGSTIAWGYSITNESSTNWLVTTALDVDVFLKGVPTFLFDFPVLYAGTTVTVPYDASIGA